MKRTLVIVLFGLLLAVLAFAICHRVATRPLRALKEQPAAEIEWLAHEFQLTPSQRNQVARLEAEYDPRCAEMCRRIEENNRKLDSLISAGQKRTPEMDALLQESAGIQAECRRVMLDHVYRVAAIMSPEQGQRYLGLMKLQVLRPGVVHQFALRP